MELKEEVLAIVEVAAEAMIEAMSDKLVDIVCEEVKKAIPGNYEDGVVELIKVAAKPQIKALLLAQAEKISAE